MKLIQTIRSKMHPVRFLFAILIGAILLFSNAIPAMAKTAPKSDPTEGLVQLDNILEKSKEATTSDPMSLEEAEQGTKNGGLNEIQGTSDRGKMKRDSKSTVVELKKSIDKATNND